MKEFLHLNLPFALLNQLAELIANVKEKQVEDVMVGAANVLAIKKIQFYSLISIDL